MVELDFSLQHSLAKLPQRAKGEAVGWDLCSCEHKEIPSGVIEAVDSGVTISHISDNIYLQIISRSGIALKGSCIVVAGLIDPDYRGTLQVLLYNTSKTDTFKVKPGDRIAQIVIHPRLTPISRTLSNTPTREGARGCEGLGSTGTQPSGGGDGRWLSGGIMLSVDSVIGPRDDHIETKDYRIEGISTADSSEGGT